MRQSATALAAEFAALSALSSAFSAADNPTTATIYANRARLILLTPNGTLDVDGIHHEDFTAACKIVADKPLGQSLAPEDIPEGLGFIPTRKVTLADVEAAFGNPAEHEGVSSQMHSLAIFGGHGTVFMDYEVGYVVARAFEVYVPNAADQAVLREYAKVAHPSQMWDDIIGGDHYGSLAEEVVRAASLDLLAAAREWAAERAGQ